jgi:cytochrome c
MQPADVRVTTSEALVAKGEALWNDASLGKTGLACGACHAGGYAQMNPTFAKPFPHRVAMPAVRSGVAQVNAAEMVNFCMLVPMNTEPLAWDSEELAALASYVEHLQPGYESFLAGSQSNPCSGNPCNPCGANPCNP